MEERAPSVSFSALLKRYRRAAGLTQAALAERAGYSTIYISKLEEGERRPLPHTVTELETALGLSPSERAALEAAAQHYASFRPSGGGSRSGSATRSGLLPLVGRMPEQHLLSRHLKGEGPPVLLLAGEPGIGKTRLLREASQRAAALGWRVLEGGCQRRSGQEPYAPVVGALGDYVRQASQASLRRALKECDWLVRLLPELAETSLVAPPSQTLPPEQERRRLFAAVGRFLANVARPAGTLFVLDDLQWAGADALELLTMLIRSKASSALRVLGAYRSTEVRPPDPLGMALGEWAAAGLAARHQLGQLARAEALDLLQQVLAGGKEPSAERTEQVLARTGGVPFFLVSCAEALRSGTLASEEETVPWTVAQSIGQRVAALPREAQNLLGVASVIGRQVERTLLVAASSSRDEEALLSALEEVDQARLFVEMREDAYQFPHDLIREVVLADLSAARRASLHCRVAGALEQMPGEPAIERLAYHYTRAAVAEKAIFYLEKAGDRAWAIYANAEGEGYYRDLLARLEVLGRSLDEARVAEKLGKVVRIQGHYEQALKLLQRAEVAYESGGDREGYWRVVVEMGWSYWRRGMFAEGLAHLRPLMETAEQSAPPRQLVAVLTLLAAHERNKGQHRAALVTAARAVELARAVGEEVPLAGPPPAVSYGRLLLDAGEAEEALQVMEEVLPLAEQMWDLTTLATVLRIPAACYLLRGEFARSQMYRERTVELDERAGDFGHIMFQVCGRGRLRFLSGDWRAGRADAERAVSLYRQIGGAGAPPQPLLLLGELSLAEGRWDEARSLLEEGLACAERMSEPERIVLAHTVFAEWELLQGHSQAAWARLEPLLDPPDREEVFLIPLCTMLSWAALDLGNAEQAAALLEQAHQRARMHQLHFSLVDPLRIQARLSMQQERWEEAQAALEEALALCRAMPYPYAKAKALHVYGRLHLLKGELGLARERLEAALAILDGLGEQLYAEQVAQALASLERE